MASEAESGIPLTHWATLVYGEYAPSMYALRCWIRKGRIQPPPQWVRGKWRVQPTASYQEHGASD
ncbi:hypothetical protein [Noviherbaspirillum sp. UKPF54]|uniref:hypothetical protein n=1 Tax=Noviherbaspirillum sp. UKPF54 TaxID=2601898 RepID=UPI0011B1A150|nr:hypothetical protein [Noviherbaspirillum sp. UKPF54]QDZ29600.1 hypothetical protein FAY22_17500 [Noviherbaspirillum sp. UKPF54]